jgi:hypothetical protein
MSLTVCLLTRDAEGTIERALQSVAALGAEVLVMDTGSKDRTAEVAEAQGAQVRTVTWQDDFAAAQNQALDQASGDWILWLNPDEELLPHGRHQLEALLGDAQVLAYVLRVQEVMKPDQLERVTETLHVRLFRRLPELRYVGRLHPHFAAPLEELAGRLHLDIRHADLIVRRHGYLSVLTEHKLRWATRLLELELRDRPGQLHYLIEYGRNLLRLNDPRGHEVLGEASEIVRAAADAPGPAAPTVASLLEYLLSVSPEQSRSRVGKEQARELALRWFGSSPPLLWVLAQQAFQAGRFAEAAGFLDKLVTLGRTGSYDRSIAFDPTIMAEHALLNLARCQVRLGNLDRAEECFRAVLASPSHGAQAQEGCNLINKLRLQMPKR